MEECVGKGEGSDRKQQKLSTRQERKKPESWEMKNNEEKKKERRGSIEAER